MTLCWGEKFTLSIYNNIHMMPRVTYIFAYVNLCKRCDFKKHAYNFYTAYKIIVYFDGCIGDKLFGKTTESHVQPKMLQKRHSPKNCFKQDAVMLRLGINLLP